MVKKYKLVGKVKKRKYRGNGIYSVDFMLADSFNIICFEGIFEKKQGQRLNNGDLIEVEADALPKGKIDNFRFRKIKE